MVIAARRWLSGVLAHAAFKVNPDPPLTFTVVRRIDQDYPDLKAVADLISGHIVGHGVAGRAFRPGDGTQHAY